MAENTQTTAELPEADQAIWIDSDLDFIQTLSLRGGDIFKRCFQCGTCSATCALSPDIEPFPSKEMAWASWGMKDRLLKDPDIWLCYQCNDCTTRCPRGARPGDILAAIRQECIYQYSFPRFFTKWVNQPRFIPLLLAIPIILLTAALYLKEPIEKALGLSRTAGAEITYAYSSFFPHWLLNSFFAFFCFLASVMAIVGISRYWRVIKTMPRQGKKATSTQNIFSSIILTFRRIFTHSEFIECTTARSRYASHLLLFFGFLALTVVTLWVITSGLNPIITGQFIYPFSFLSPWKILANLGGLAVLVGCALMIWDRLKENAHTKTSSYYDWSLLGSIMIVIITGFITEALHYVHLEPHRHIAYFVHLVFVFNLLVYLPFSKFAHVIYRTTALVYAENTGRKVATNNSDKSISPSENKPLSKVEKI